MANLKSRVERLEKEQQFRTWIGFERFLESLTDEQLEELALHWRFPEVLPEPLPKGASRLDGLDRKTLLKLWEESEREIAQIMEEMEGRSLARIMHVFRDTKSLFMVQSRCLGGFETKKRLSLERA